MNLFFYILVAVGLLILIAIIIASNKSKNSSSIKPRDFTSGPNDKLVVVKNISHDELKKIIADYKETNDEEDLSVALTTLDEDTFVFTFPENISFDSFCVFINYLNYPMDSDAKLTVLGWTTIKEDSRLGEKALNKKAMLFIPEDDEEFDEVYITTEDNIGFIYSFAIGNNKRLLKAPKKNFVAPTISVESLASKPTESL